ncbi:MAG TPA: hypothetical protein VLB44_13745 [Kofleriaceae bacterium]|nr:hypothetical protein [Kofleriaceae bacterium]
MRLTSDDLCAHVASHAGVSVEGVDQAVRAVLSGLGAYLSGAQRQLVSEELPPPLAPSLDEIGENLSKPIEERVLAPGMSAGRARELVASVCRVLAEELSTEALRALRTAVPAAIGELLEGEAPPLATGVASSRPDSLASGRPGSHHPLSEARPRDRIQSDSVVATNPHADSKLSSARGTTQEREHDTLAEGQPSPTRKLSTSRS